MVMANSTRLVVDRDKPRIYNVGTGDSMDLLLLLRLLKPFFHYLLLEHGGVPHVLPLAVHLDLFMLSRGGHFKALSL